VSVAVPGVLTVLVVAKAPVPGLAKTRLMPVLTAEQAARVAAAALLDTLDAVAAVPGVNRVVALTGDLAAATDAEELRSSLHRFTVLPQRGDGLGERLAAAHHDAALATGGPVLQIGMDTPQVSGELLLRCADRLLRPDVDAVLGVAHDGGWWALGVRTAELAGVLPEVAMSRADTAARTIRALRSRAARVALLAELGDVDEVGDAASVAMLVPGSRFHRAVSAVGLLDIADGQLTR